MINCEACNNKEWCSSEEMDREECPVRPKDSFRSFISVIEGIKVGDDNA